MAQSLGVSKAKKTIFRPGVWLLILLFLFITFLQYARVLGQPSFLANLNTDIGLTRYTAERILYLIPIVWASLYFGWKGGIETEVKVLGEERRLPAEVELVLFRIVQEGLRNVWKHAQATKASVTIEFGEGKTRVTVSDNGKGFDTRQRMGDLLRYGKLGLAGIRERTRLLGGNLTFLSELVRELF